MKVKVIAANFGTYKVGDEIEMHESTAKAVAKHGKIAIIGEAETEVSTEITKKKGRKSK